MQEVPLNNAIVIIFAEEASTVISWCIKNCDVIDVGVTVCVQICVPSVISGTVASAGILDVPDNPAVLPE